VRTILQGSVLRAGGRIRINAELADATTGANLWAQGFDQPLTDIFTIQDDIARKIVTTLSLMFKLGNLQVPHGGGLEPTDNLQAFDNLLRGVEYQWRLTEQGNAKARELFQKAAELDSKYAEAYAGIAGTYLFPVLFSWTQNWQADLKRASEFSEKALALDDSNLGALITLVWVDVLQFKDDQAVADAERAVALNPNYAGGYETLAEALIFDWKPQQALPNVQKAMRLDPKSETFYVFDIGFADLFMGRYAEAAQMFEKHLAVYPNLLNTHVLLSIAYSELGRYRDARAQAAEVMRLNPRYRIILPEKWVPRALAGRWDTDEREAGLKPCPPDSIARQTEYPNCRG